MFRSWAKLRENDVLPTWYTGGIFRIELRLKGSPGSVKKTCSAVGWAAWTPTMVLTKYTANQSNASLFVSGVQSLLVSSHVYAGGGWVKVDRRSFVMVQSPVLQKTLSST